MAEGRWRRQWLRGIRCLRCGCGFGPRWPTVRRRGMHYRMPAFDITDQPGARVTVDRGTRLDRACHRVLYWRLARSYGPARPTWQGGCYCSRACFRADGLEILAANNMRAALKRLRYVLMTKGVPGWGGYRFGRRRLVVAGARVLARGSP